MMECALPYRALRRCRIFQELSVGERVRRVEQMKLCKGYLMVGHTIKARESPCQKENDELCHKKRYGKGHHKLLHMIGGGDEGESSGPRVPCSVPELNQHETGPVLCGSGAVV
jgi:hypothetical protein